MALSISFYSADISISYKDYYSVSLSIWDKSSADNLSREKVDYFI